MEYVIRVGDNLDSLKEMADNSIDSIVTDPPYGWSFMQSKWDYEIPSVETWEECLRVLKPGGHMLCACGTRTQHRMAVNIEDSGFEIRDIICWAYGSGFPKSLNVGKFIDKLHGNEREDLGEAPKLGGRTGKNPYQSEDDNFNGDKDNNRITKGTSPYEGWGTALKPAVEFWTLARKPLSEKSVAENVLKYGTGGINIDGCRVEATEFSTDKGTKRPQSEDYVFKSFDEASRKSGSGASSQLGRFPANLIHDGSEEVVSLFPNSKSTSNPRINANESNNKNCYGDYKNITSNGFDDSGSAARFFYCAKCSKKDRNEGLDDFYEKQTVGGGGGIGNYLNDVNSASGKYGSEKAPSKNNHPTLKPTELMQYLCRLITPKGGVVLDPFMGSGSTGKACMYEGFSFIGMELDEEYCKIAEARIEYAKKQVELDDKQMKLF